MPLPIHKRETTGTKRMEQGAVIQYDNNKIIIMNEGWWTHSNYFLFIIHKTWKEERMMTSNQEPRQLI
jgi:hypothetical protein